MKTISKETLDFIQSELRLFVGIHECKSKGYIWLNSEVYEVTDSKPEPKKLTLEEIIEDVSYNMTKERASSLYDQAHARTNLQAVADYLNGDWKPDWSVVGLKYFLIYDSYNDSLLTKCREGFQTGSILFKSEEAAKEALEILGEDKVKTALGCYLKP